MTLTAFLASPQAPKVLPTGVCKCSNGLIGNPQQNEGDNVISQILCNNERWATEKKETDANYFKNLSQGQQPPVLFIGCADSRVCAEQIMGVGPGDVFVHRNVANLVQATDVSANASIEYAVEYLNVKHVIICGHYKCGGVQAALSQKDYGVLNPWLKEIKDVHQRHKETLETLEGEHQYKKLVELNVLEQCLNLYKVSCVQKACEVRGLQIHGWVFDLESGRLLRLPINVKELQRSGKNYIFK